jgi:hypothetical protein
MIQRYEEPLFLPSPKETKQALIAHCETFPTYYANAADEAEALAKHHRQKNSGPEP